MKYQTVLFALIGLFTVSSCSSKKIVPTTDICSVVKHWKDNVFQITINKEPINKHWFTHPEAMDLTAELAKSNKCMK
jgi:hypothetical protein